MIEINEIVTNAVGHKFAVGLKIEAYGPMHFSPTSMHIRPTDMAGYRVACTILKIASIVIRLMSFCFEETTESLIIVQNVSVRQSTFLCPGNIMEKKSSFFSFRLGL